MKTIGIDTPLTEVRKIDNQREKALAKLSLLTVRDLFYYYPVKFRDLRKITLIQDLRPGMEATIKGTIKTISAGRTRQRRMVITKALISDSSGSVSAVWFNQRFVASSLGKGQEVYLHGKVELGEYGPTLLSPEYERFKNDPSHLARIVPVYPLTGNLTSKWLRFILKSLLPLAEEMPDYLPEEIIKKHKLLSLGKALQKIHFPSDMKNLSQAKRRLAFDELFLLELNAWQNRYRWERQTATILPADRILLKKFLNQLPFRLTLDQEKATKEILSDMAKSRPMNRLLDGDVGSGKTVVAAVALLTCAARGYQAALMVPTEVLAGQHYIKLLEYFSGLAGPLGLLTREAVRVDRKSVSKARLLALAKAGEIKIIIGTHALIQKDLRFKNLRLAVVDEQHRFGVKQRQTLVKMSGSQQTAPHLLSMTATPIPRTLALSIFGDLDLSVIKNLPQGRKKILTKVVPPNKRQAAYRFIAAEVRAGRQVFVICPLIEESDKLGVKSVTVEYEKLKKEIFPELTLGLMHGKLKREDKEKIMADFAANKINILVSTSVVEVGIDVPNATVMMIEGADRFGLAQLHQFRGRVGRGDHQSYCFLFTDSKSEKTAERLAALERTSDGFLLAKKDLEQRGPGEIYGRRQSGLPDLKMASLLDARQIKLAREEAESFLASRTLADYPLLATRLAEFINNIHFE